MTPKELAGKELSAARPDDLSVPEFANELGASGGVFIFNCSPAPLTSITASAGGNFVQVFSSAQGIPPASGSSPFVSAARIGRGAGPGLFPDTSQLSVYLDGNTVPAWTYTVILSGSATWASYYLWCFVNGYILGDQSGNVRSTVWQAAYLAKFKK